VKGSGTWSDRDPEGNTQKVWNYIRDTLLKDVQRFYRTLNAVLNMGLSGLTHEEKVNIAVAMFLKKMKDGDTHYQHRNFDANKWRLYKAHLVLKMTGKLAEPTAARKPSEEVADEDTPPLDTDGDEGFITDSTAIKPTTKGKNKIIVKGRDAAKRAELREDHMKKRTTALKAFADTEKKKLKVMEDVKVQVHTQNIIAMLNHPSVADNPAISERLVRQVLSSFEPSRARQSANQSANQLAINQIPGDLLNREEEDQDDIDIEDDDENFENTSDNSEAMNRPLGGEVLDDYNAAMARGRALAERRAAV